MASYNKVLLMGNLTKAPEVRYTPNGSAVCDFSIALNRRYQSNGQDRDEVCYVDVVVWAKQAESCGRYLQKGSPVFVEGRLRNDNWEDKDGNKRSRLRVTAERVQFMSSGSNRSDDNKQFDSETTSPSNGQMQGYQGNIQGEAAQQQPYHSEQPVSNNERRQQSDQPSHYQGGGNDNQQGIPRMPMPETFDSEYEADDDIPF